MRCAYIGAVLTSIAVNAMKPDDKLDRFRLVRALGHGTYGAVWLAEDELLKCEVVLKILHPHLLEGSSLERLRREVLLARRLTHVAIGRVYDLHRVERAGVVHWFLTMEFIDGQTYSRHLSKNAPLELTTALRFTEAICRGVEAAHECGVLHRDLKPGNILIRNGDQQPVILDFGLATSGDLETITKKGDILGTASYIPPEVWAGEPADERADLWAIGVMLFTAIAGELPFRRASLNELIERVSSKPAPRLDRVRREVPRVVADACALALAIKKDERPPSVAALRRRLRDARKGIEGDRTVIGPLGPMSGVESQTPSLATVIMPVPTDTEVVPPQTTVVVPAPVDQTFAVKKKGPAHASPVMRILWAVGAAIAMGAAVTIAWQISQEETTLDEAAIVEVTSPRVSAPAIETPEVKDIAPSKTKSGGARRAFRSAEKALYNRLRERHLAVEDIAGVAADVALMKKRARRSEFAAARRAAESARAKVDAAKIDKALVMAKLARFNRRFDTSDDEGSERYRKLSSKISDAIVKPDYARANRLLHDGLSRR